MISLLHRHVLMFPSAWGSHHLVTSVPAARSPGWRCVSLLRFIRTSPRTGVWGPVCGCLACSREKTAGPLLYVYPPFAPG